MSGLVIARCSGLCPKKVVLSCNGRALDALQASISLIEPRRSALQRGVEPEKSRT